jgi:hypothetical protein
VRALNRKRERREWKLSYPLYICSLAHFFLREAP